MLKAKDFRRYAREALSGRWIKAGGIGLLAGLLGAAISSSGSGSVGGSVQTDSDMTAMISQGMPEIPAAVFAVIMGVALVVLLWAIVIIVIGGATTLGYAKYNLNLVDDKDPQMGDIFSQYNRLGTGFGMQFFRGLFVSLWSLLFIIPGIIASYSYYMTPFILCENPEMKSLEAIKESKKLMKGNRWRLFCLEFSFIGWYFLSSLVMAVAMIVGYVSIIVIGGGSDYAIMSSSMIMMAVVVIAYVVVLALTIAPYEVASVAVFYREISEGRYSNPRAEVESTAYVYENVWERQDTE